jgi:diaminopimelate epimerase
MHGIGNDFVVVDAVDFAHIPLQSQPDVVRQLCDRHCGIGAVGLLTYAPKPDGLEFCIFNADGSRDTMCGNGLRCVVSLLAKDGRIPIDGIAKTDSGDVHYTSQSALQVMLQLPAPQDFHAPITIGDFTFSCLNTGSPHAVVLLPDGQGPNPVTFVSVSCDLENHVDFPSGISTNWVWRDASGGLRLRTWERGVGETLACGTGTCAAGVAFIKAFPQEKTIPLTSEGGSLVVSWDGSPDDPVFLTGPAEFVMQGTISIPDSVLTSQVGV